MLLRRALLVVSGAVLLGLLTLGIGTAPLHAAYPGASGRIIYVCVPDSQELCVIDADGGRFGYLTQYDYSKPNHDEHDPAWSPDGRRVAFVVIGYCEHALYVMNADRTGLRLVLREKATSAGIWELGSPSWSPDGSKLVFSKAFARGRCPQELPPESSQLYVINVSGTGQHQLTNAGSGFDSQPAWSPNGLSIAYARDNEGVGFDSGLWVVSPDGSGANRLYASGASFPDWSPDGTRIVFQCHVGGDICVSSTGGGLTVLGPGSQPAWSPDGTRIVFFGGGFLAGISVMAADGTGRHEIAHGGYQGAIGFPDWQPCPNGVCPPAPGVPTSFRPAKPRQKLFATVGPGFTIAIRTKSGRRLKTLIAGTYPVLLKDRSSHHSFHLARRGLGRTGTTVKAVVTSQTEWALTPGKYRYFCDAHPAIMRGSFHVIADPQPYRP